MCKCFLVTLSMHTNMGTTIPATILKLYHPPSGAEGCTTNLKAAFEKSLRVHNPSSKTNGQKSAPRKDFV